MKLCQCKRTYDNFKQDSVLRPQEDNFLLSSGNRQQKLAILNPSVDFKIPKLNPLLQRKSIARTETFKNISSIYNRYFIEYVESGHQKFHNCQSLKRFSLLTKRKEFKETILEESESFQGEYENLLEGSRVLQGTQLYFYKSSFQARLKTFSVR